MDDQKIDAMLRELLEAIDHDIAKSYDAATSEEPEFVEDEMEELRSIVRTHLVAEDPS